MADYWISRDKYFCKYCNIYIADDKPSRLHHETGLRHKGNYERYIRDIYKKGAQQKKDRAEEAKELARVEAAAAAAMGLPPPEPVAVPVASSSKPAPAPAPKPADPFANYTTAASLGIRDEAAERAAADAERRQNEGVIGQWEKVVKPRQAPVPSTEGEGKGKRRAAGWEGEGFAGRTVLRPELGATGGIKSEEPNGDGLEDRKPAIGTEGPSSDVKPRRLDEEEEEEDEHTLGVVEAAQKRGFLSEKKALPSLYDSDPEDDPLAKLGPIKLKKRRLTVKEQQAEEEARLAKKTEVEEILKAREESRRMGGGAGRKGWEAVEVGADGEEGFDPLAGLEVPNPEEAEPEEGAAEGAQRDGEQDGRPPAQDEETKPVQPAGLFKKRKRPGAMRAK
ncbi:hypothetical protein JCM10908_005628 [Rhodotorula pacifica]|uniref:uncharacterized protein n=1 Tax=Rhodotorula pacifica TaxID=1495444 RepID=UPI00317D3933